GGGAPAAKGRRAERPTGGELEGEEDGISRRAPRGDEAGFAARAHAAQGRRHHRRGREGHGLATALRARGDQRRTQEEARSGRRLRQARGSGPRLSDRKALTPRAQTLGRLPWPT